MTEAPHIVRSYDEELGRLDTLVARMGGLAEAQLECAVRALARRDSDLAGRVVANDSRIDSLDREMHATAVRLLALRQPAGVDLRTVVSCLTLSGDLERMGDYAANIGKRVLALNQVDQVATAHSVPRMGTLVQELVHEVVEAFLSRDAARARAVWRRDTAVDDVYASFFREAVTYMMEDPHNITACTHLMFIAKNVERIGDHCTNIAERVHFLVAGEVMPVRHRVDQETPEGGRDGHGNDG